MNFLIMIILIITFTFSNSILLFRIKSSEPYCLGQEFSLNSVLVLKYKIFTPSRKNIDQIFPYLTLYLHDAKSDRKLKTEHIFASKGKFTFNIEKEGLYEICIQTNRYSAILDLKEDLFVNMKINPDFYDEETLLSDALNTKDIYSLNEKSKEITSMTKPIIEFQKNQLEVENEVSLKTLSNANLYKYLTFIQLLVTIFIGLIQVCNFRRFLKSQNII